MAFMGLGTSLTPSELLPFANGQGGPGGGGPGNQPQGGIGAPGRPAQRHPVGPALGRPRPVRLRIARRGRQLTGAQPRS